MSVAAFLRASGWAEARHAALAGDASARRYARLTGPDGRAILMQDPGGDTARFAALARHLCGIGLSAPRILAEDHGAGLLLLEDLGDGLIARLATTAQAERALYATATDALIALHRHPAPDGLATATPEALAAATEPAFTQYAARPDLAPACAEAFRPCLARHAPPEGVCVLRDYHAENILDLPGRDGAARAGLLDFQDALSGHPAYDLASLLRDARRDLFPGTAEACIARYCAATGRDRAAFEAALAVLGAQRNLRILGVFARLAAAGKPRYLAMLPRVWGHLQADLRHPALADVARALAPLPEPDDAHIETLRSRCPTP